MVPTLIGVINLLCSFVDRMNLEEQLDDMVVKASEDAANLHSLQIQVDTLDEGKKCKQVKLQQSFRLHFLSHAYIHISYVLSCNRKSSVLF